MELGSFQEYTVKGQNATITSCSKWNFGWTYKEKILQNGSGEAVVQIVLWRRQSLDTFKIQLEKAMSNLIWLWS